jgi:pimeloyl-ACP methyl ester carboxylesterase
VPLSDLSWGRRLLLVLAADNPAAIPPTQARMMVEASASAQRTAAAFRSITAADLRPLLRKIHAPLGVVWGARDRTVPLSHVDVIRGARPEAEVVVIERAGHVVMVERPEEFVDALEGLLRTLPKDATTDGRSRSNVP